MAKTNGHVTWTGLFAFMAIVSLGIGAGFTYTSNQNDKRMEQHCEQPHEGSVRLRELAPITDHLSVLAAGQASHAASNEQALQEIMVALAKLSVQVNALEGG